MCDVSVTEERSVPLPSVLPATSRLPCKGNCCHGDACQGSSRGSSRGRSSSTSLTPQCKHGDFQIEKKEKPQQQVASLHPRSSARPAAFKRCSCAPGPAFPTGTFPREPKRSAVLIRVWLQRLSAEMKGFHARFPSLPFPSQRRLRPRNLHHIKGGFLLAPR